MTTYSLSTPYLYAIGWTGADRWYLGVRFAKGCSPSDLWTTYFTSSKEVAALRQLIGEPDHIEVLATGTADEMNRAEQLHIIENDIAHDPRWLNKGVWVGPASNTFTQTPEAKAKRRATVQRNMADPAKKAALLAQLHSPEAIAKRVTTKRKNYDADPAIRERCRLSVEKAQAARRKYTDDQIAAVRSAPASMSNCQIARETGVERSNVSRIRRGLSR